MGICYIAGAGEFTARDFHPKEEDFIIAADGGLRALDALGIKPQLIIGDLDSLGSYPLPADVPLEKHPVEKDDTDTGIALAQGFSMGYRHFRLYGCSGGRPDHLLANFQTMGKYSQLGAKVRMVAPDYDAYVITNTSLSLPAKPAQTTVSIFCHGAKAEGVTLQGLKYPLRNHTLTCDYPLGVSNQHTAEPAMVSVTNGTLLILQYTQPE